MARNTTSPQADNYILRRTDFDKQLTQEVMERVVKQTIALIADLEKKTPWRDQLGAEDRLHTAIVKTLEGTRKWEPERVDLGGHLFGAVRSDITAELQHRNSFRHISWEGGPANDREALREEVELTLARDSETIHHARPAWELAMSALRDAANGDPEVVALLGAYLGGAFTKREVMKHSKLKSRAYDRAYARLVELADTINDDQSDFILQAIA